MQTTPCFMPAPVGLPSVSEVLQMDLRSKYVSPLNRVTPRPQPNGFTRGGVETQEGASAWKRKAYRWRRHRRELREGTSIGCSGVRKVREWLYWNGRSRGGGSFSCTTQGIQSINQSPGVDLFYKGEKNTSERRSEIGAPTSVSTEEKEMEIECVS